MVGENHEEGSLARSEQQRQVEQFFSSTASEYYDERYRGSEGKVSTYSYFKRKDCILNMVDDHGGRILDIGCGPGILSSDLLEKGYEVWGIDLSDRMVQEATKTVDSHRLRERAHFGVGNIELLRFPDNYFDVVVCSGVVSYLEDPTIGLREVKRVLKRGGTAIVTVPTKRQSYDFLKRTSLAVFKPVFRNRGTLLGKTVTRLSFTHKRYRPWELDRLLSELGFRKEASAHYHFILFPLDILFPRLSLSLAVSLQRKYSHSASLGWLGKSYVIRVRRT